MSFLINMSKLTIVERVVIADALPLMKLIPDLLYASHNMVGVVPLVMIFVSLAKGISFIDIGISPISVTYVSSFRNGAKSLNQ